MSPESSFTTVGSPLVLHLGPTLQRLTDEEFFGFCQLNRDWRIERTAEGDLLIMPPTGGETGRRNVALITQLGVHCRNHSEGIAFDSSTGFRLANGATRSPDAAWIRREQWEGLTDDEHCEFPPLAPDFVVELRSLTDDLAALRAKMNEYIAVGVQLAWLINPQQKSVEVYRPNGPPLILDYPETLDADPVVPGFRLDLTTIW